MPVTAHKAFSLELDDGGVDFEDSFGHGFLKVAKLKL